jgi:hypothetical protein
MRSETNAQTKAQPGRTRRPATQGAIETGTSGDTITFAAEAFHAHPAETDAETEAFGGRVLAGVAAGARLLRPSDPS